MNYDVQTATAVLRRTPAVLDALLRDLPDDWTRPNEGGDSWSAYDIVGHLIHGERTNWIPRAAMIVESGETRTFERIDRLAQARESQGKTLARLLDEFADARADSLDLAQGGASRCRSTPTPRGEGAQRPASAPAPPTT